MKTVIVVGVFQRKLEKLVDFSKMILLLPHLSDTSLIYLRKKFLSISKTILNQLIKLCLEKVRLSRLYGIIIKVIVYYWLQDDDREGDAIAWHCGKNDECKF